MHARQPACNRARPDMSTNCSPHPVLSAFDSLMQCAGRADGFGGDDGAAVGGTGSVPDLSAMRLDSFHEARRATLAYITGDGAAPPSDTSTSGDSGARLLPSSEKRPLHGSPVLPTARKEAFARQSGAAHRPTPRILPHGCWPAHVAARGGQGALTVARARQEGQGGSRARARRTAGRRHQEAWSRELTPGHPAGTLFKSASVTLERERRQSIGNGVHKDSDSMRRRSVRRASNIAQVRPF